MAEMIGEERELGAPARVGVVVAVCFSPDHPKNGGMFKQPHESAEFTYIGVPGDRHYGATYWTPEELVGKINYRPITVATVECTQVACDKLGIPRLVPGDLGENMTIEGMGDLSDAGPSDVLRVVTPEGETVVEFDVLGQNNPCVKLRQYHRLLCKELYGKRGLVCRTSKEGVVRPGYRVELYKRTE